MSIQGSLDSVVVVSASVTYGEKKGVLLNRGRFESEYKDQFHIVICTYSYYQTDICF